MDAPRKSRHISVEDQLFELKHDLSMYLARAFLHEVNHAYWAAMTRQSKDTEYEIRHAITEAFDVILRRWESIDEVRAILTAARDIFKEGVIMCIDVPRPPDTDEFLIRILENVMIFFESSWIPRIEFAMRPYQHNIEVIQRNWRRCYYEPNHPACKRRLVRQFENMSLEMQSV
jgi:hypothetical protein